MSYQQGAGEQLLRQLTTVVSDLCFDVPLQKLHMAIAGCLSIYDIRPARLPGCNPDIREKVDQFLSAKRLEGLSEYTISGYQLELRIFAGHVPKPIDEIDTGDIRDYLSRFDHLKMSSISKKLSVLKSFFGWLADEEIITKDPARRIKPPKKEQRLPKALTIEELEMLREACRTPRERAMVEVFYATGGRLSEIQALNKGDIDYQAMAARVVGKGNKEREVYLSYKALYHLKKYIMGRLDEEPALFITERRPFRRISNRGIQRAISIIATRSGVQKNVHPHTMRHTFATLTLNNGADLSSVQALLGHSDPATTQIYAQVSEAKKKEAYQKHLVQ
ncbi:MAG: tyrosine-type recombinase/integrase [Syntrophomonadaceae bacterium]|nr:tyrosine-type recombinase/integrase [Syntrophomonadaceae bacterium]